MSKQSENKIIVIFIWPLDHKINDLFLLLLEKILVSKIQKKQCATHTRKIYKQTNNFLNQAGVCVFIMFTFCLSSTKFLIHDDVARQTNWNFYYYFHIRILLLNSKMTSKTQTTNIFFSFLTFVTILKHELPGHLTLPKNDIIIIIFSTHMTHVFIMKYMRHLYKIWLLQWYYFFQKWW